jgi:hypothetical protein
MKKIILISVLLFFTGLNGLMAQFANVNPIPSFNYQMTEEYAGFQELGPDGQTEEKRDMNVEVTASSRDDNYGARVFATVWIVKKNSSKFLGPFTVYSDERLTVEINNEKWGVVIHCEWDINVSVWTGGAE